MTRRPDPTDEFDAKQTLVAHPRRSASRPAAPPPRPPAPRAQSRVARGTEAPPPPPPRALPSFVPAETAVPVVQYRGAPPPPSPAPPPTRAAIPAAVPSALDPTRATVALAPRLAPPSAAGYPAWTLPRDPAPAPPAPPPRAATPALPVAEIGARSSLRGRIVAVVGCRGGAGATTLAVNLGAELARDARACVVDLDLHVGDVLGALDLDTRTSIAQLAADLDTSPDLDASAVRRRLALHRSGLFAVGQAAACEPRTFPALVPGLLRGLARHHDHVVVDGIRGFDDIAVAALAAADQVLLVVCQDVLSVRRAARAVVRLRQLGHGVGLSLVVNRVRGGATVDAAAIEKALGLRIGAAVRDDSRVQAALDGGALLSELPRARDVAHDVGEMARLVDAARRPAARRRGLLGRLLGGS
jgi:MinD-like ATPase involved in chromosome partitioning or flagellar assembly